MGCCGFRETRACQTWKVLEEHLEESLQVQLGNGRSLPESTTSEAIPRRISPGEPIRTPIRRA
jgi:hypothetical protein